MNVLEKFKRHMESAKSRPDAAGDFWDEAAKAQNLSRQEFLEAKIEQTAAMERAANSLTDDEIMKIANELDRNIRGRGCPSA